MVHGAAPGRPRPPPRAAQPDRVRRPHAVGWDVAAVWCDAAWDRRRLTAVADARLVLSFFFFLGGGMGLVTPQHTLLLLP